MRECTDVSYVAGEGVELTGVSKTRGRGQSVGVYLLFFFKAWCFKVRVRAIVNPTLKQHS